MMASNGSAASASQLINDSVREIYCQQSVNPAHDSSVEYSPHQYAIKAHIQYLSTSWRRAIGCHIRCELPDVISTTNCSWSVCSTLIIIEGG